MRQNSVAYFAFGLTLIGFQEDIEKIVPLDNLNDERCLQTIAAIQRLNSNTKNFCCTELGVPTAFAQHILALSLLRKIHFD
uniref:Uncharacterized protein n=1 Tax=Globodera pallida TaxID=36090 RepID=A0A183BQG8_GLOPA